MARVSIQLNVFTLEETVGDYTIKRGFPSAAERQKYEQKQKPGYWYDWDEASSNSPSWGDVVNGVKLIDKETGEEIRRVLFYHSGTDYVERIAEDTDGVPQVSNLGEEGVCRIYETRDLEFVPKENRDA